MLLLFFNAVGGDSSAPVYSTGFGVECLETTIFADELTASVLIADLSSSVLIADLSSAVQTDALTFTAQC